MNYIYDISLNLNKNNLYEFYEWNESDNIEFILKIPFFKIDDESFDDIRNNDIIIDKKILNSIEDKTESYLPNGINIIRYACIFVNTKSAFAIEFDSEGNNYMKSNISIDEESEIVDIASNIKYTLVDYKIKNKYKINLNFSTRKEKTEEKYLLKKLEKIKNNNEESKLKYIFYEIFNEKTDNIDKIYSKLINIVKTNDKKREILNNILKIMDNKKIVSNN